MHLLVNRTDSAYCFTRIRIGQVAASAPISLSSEITCGHHVLIRLYTAAIQVDLRVDLLFLNQDVSHTQSAS